MVAILTGLHPRCRRGSFAYINHEHNWKIKTTRKAEWMDNFHPMMMRCCGERLANGSASWLAALMYVPVEKKSAVNVMVCRPGLPGVGRYPSTLPLSLLYAMAAPQWLDSLI